MKKINILFYIGLIILIGGYVYIFNAKSHGETDFVNSRLKQTKINSVTKLSKTSFLNELKDNFAIEYNFKANKYYEAKNDNSKFLVLEYKNDADSTNDKQSFTDFVTDSKNQKKVKIPDFKDFKNIDKNVKDLKLTLKQISNRRDNFDFGVNSNFMVIQLNPGNVNINEIVRLLH